MSPQCNSFSPVESKASEGLTLFIKMIGISLLIITPLSIIIMAIPVFNTKEISTELKIILLSLFTIIASFFAWLIIQKKQKNTTTHIIADEKGLHHYCNRNILHSITFTDLNPNPENGKYDVFLTEYEESAPCLCVYLFEQTLNKSTYKTVNLDIDVVITNGNLLLKNFVKGILIFRPDLKVAPNVLNLFRLEEFDKSNCILSASQSRK
ncbi:hypothetical protein [Chryseobacterium populi]|uniref:Transmembrane protein n=1 Tax=Chryseobacterium populi TaxID=1144316 RepID=J3CIS0_9FLAO|nr:hypothetical protein [Chryseobacterium populi]EJL72429.1 hypothetical protein PMI13_01921 [Chryseobacterium populi]